MHGQIFIFLWILPRKLLGNHVQRTLGLFQSHARLQPGSGIDPTIIAPLQEISVRRRYGLLHHVRHPYIRNKLKQYSSDVAVRRHSHYGESVIVYLDRLSRYVGIAMESALPKVVV